MDKSLLDHLKPLRDQIDSIDQQLLQLLNQRAQMAIEVGKVKLQFSADDSIIKPEREAQIIRKLQQGNRTQAFPKEAVNAVWTEIISACRGLERGLRIAYLGPKGSFSEQAAYQFYGHAIVPVPCASFDEVFRSVEAGQADCGMVPVENSTEGAVNRTQDLLLKTTLKVHGERTLPIRHCLLTQTGTMRGVKRVLAHPQALAQCHHWLSQNYPNVTPISVASNSEAVRLVTQDPEAAAIAGSHAALAWDVNIVAEGIQDDANNKTRFLAIGHVENHSTGRDQTSLIVAVPNRVGAVHELIAPFAEHNVSMSRFESRPARTGQWEYYFYIDILGHQEDAAVKKALADLHKLSSFLKILGSYPQQ
ncbi:prephenate dehydratase [Brackiella oedipodis]|uniref:prephenate dehydratase n=1 Tax=Brackiella oedipodis TaxID=124225 RepID=UPI00048F5B28|nr:prephenate dehydratase [Brackiella oedipodis]